MRRKLKSKNLWRFKRNSSRKEMRREDESLKLSDKSLRLKGRRLKKQTDSCRRNESSIHMKSIN
jgi:hypothetical protein